MISDAMKTAALCPPTFDAFKPAEDKTPIAVLMSGGVDSSVTALLLREAGWDIVGVTMKIPVISEGLVRRPCCGTGAALVCKDLGVPHYFVDVEDAFRACVVDPFRAAYCAGTTPSPCVDCNTRLKFGAVWDLVHAQLGIEHVATGHYARVETSGGGGAFLKRGEDKSRDQSYFLYGVSRERLPYLHLPLGGLAKTEVRQIASSRGLHVAAKADSMELCFAAEGDYRKLLTDVPCGPGPICDTEGRILGEHKGIHQYTIGQRRGLGISSADGLYVLEILPATNTIVVGPRERGFRSEIRAVSVNELQPEKLRVGAEFLGKIRSVGEPDTCRVTRADAECLEVHFDTPVFAPASGQHLVLYDDEAIVAGGVIEELPR